MAKDEDGYNGWKNYQTRNVALWGNNDEGLYQLARECQDYAAYEAALREAGITETPDQVAYNDSGLDIEALNEWIRSLDPDAENDSARYH